MRTAITFYGAAIDPNTGMPDPYHAYDVWERPAPWSGPNATVATIYQLTAGAPMPGQVHFLVHNAAAGAATQQARAALQAIPALQGLTCVWGLAPNHPLQQTRPAMLLPGSSQPTEAGRAAERGRSA